MTPPDDNDKQLSEFISMFGKFGESPVTEEQIEQVRRIAIPAIRRIEPGTVAQELIGVQPMQDVVGSIFSFRYTAPVIHPMDISTIHPDFEPQKEDNERKEI